MNDRPWIIIDADVVSHFIRGGRIFDLHQIFELPIYLLDKVNEELMRSSGFKALRKQLIEYSVLRELPFPEDDPEIRKECPSGSKELRARSRAIHTHKQLIVDSTCYGMALKGPCISASLGRFACSGLWPKVMAWEGKGDPTCVACRAYAKESPGKGDAPNRKP